MCWLQNAITMETTNKDDISKRAKLKFMPGLISSIFLAENYS